MTNGRTAHSAGERFSMPRLRHGAMTQVYRESASATSGKGEQDPPRRPPGVAIASLSFGEPRERFQRLDRSFTVFRLIGAILDGVSLKTFRLDSDKLMLLSVFFPRSGRTDRDSGNSLTRLPKERLQSRRRVGDEADPARPFPVKVALADSLYTWSSPHVSAEHRESFAGRSARSCHSSWASASTGISPDIRTFCDRERPRSWVTEFGKISNRPYLSQRPDRVLGPLAPISLSNGFVCGLHEDHGKARFPDGAS